MVRLGQSGYVKVCARETVCGARIDASPALLGLLRWIFESCPASTRLVNTSDYWKLKRRYTVAINIPP